MKNLKIILNEDVYNLGEEGDVREVAPGYGRNYLIPKGLAVLHSRENVARFKDKQSAIERRREEKRTSALGLKDRIEEMQLEFAVPAGSSGKLFGSITNAAIADRLMQDGLTIERKKIEIPGHTFKQIGDYEIIIKLYADESAALKVKITPEGGDTKPGTEAAPKSEKKAPPEDKKQKIDSAKTAREETEADEPDSDAPSGHVESESPSDAVEPKDAAKAATATETETESAIETEAAAEAATETEAAANVESNANKGGEEAAGAEYSSDESPAAKDQEVDSTAASEAVKSAQEDKTGES